MKTSYKSKRMFWHNLKNFDRPNILSFGLDEIIVAGAEFVFCDSKGNPKNIFIAVNSQGESQMYYEEDNAFGFGNIHGNKTKIFENIINAVLQDVSELTYNMNRCSHLPACPKFNFVNFYALGRKGKFSKTLTYREIHFPKHLYYPLYTYFRQLIEAMRKAALQSL